MKGGCVRENVEQEDRTIARNWFWRL